MKPALNAARMVEKRSDEKDGVGLFNAIRDDIINKQVNSWPKVKTTTDATPTIVWSDTMAPNSVADLTLAVVASVAGAASVAGYRRRVVVLRVGTAAVTYLGGGADVIGVDKESVAAWDVAFGLDAANPSNIYAVVTGAAGVTINWRANIKGIVQPW